MNEKKKRPAKDRVRHQAKRRKGIDPEAVVAAQWDHIDDRDDVPISSIFSGVAMHGGFTSLISDVLAGCVLAWRFVLASVIKLAVIYQIAMIAAAWNSPKACKRLDGRLERLVPAGKLACYLTERVRR